MQLPERGTRLKFAANETAVPDGCVAGAGWLALRACVATRACSAGKESHLLGQFYATGVQRSHARPGRTRRFAADFRPPARPRRGPAICGNDITASCLYTVGLAVASAGIYAPIALFLVVCMLYLFRSVYGEVCSALPLNGGAYNALLNTTTKGTASVGRLRTALRCMYTHGRLIAQVAACLTILSYVATGGACVRGRLTHPNLARVTPLFVLCSRVGRRGHSVPQQCDQHRLYV